MTEERLCTSEQGPIKHNMQGLINLGHLNKLSAVRFWQEPKNSHRTQESPPWRASAASSGADSTVNTVPMQTGCGRVVGGGVGRGDLLELIN
jgi:hypothetical protein